MVNLLDPTKDQALAAMKSGVPLPVAAQFSKGYADAYNEIELRELTARAAEAKAKGVPLSINDQLALERALKQGWLVREKELYELEPRELMKTGLHQAELDRQGEAVKTLNELTRLTQELEAAVRAPKWNDFPGKAEAARKAREIRAQFEEAAKGVAVQLGHLTDSEYKQTAFGHVNTLRKRLEAKSEE